MRRALVTYATGEHTRLLDVALPSFEAFADRHGYTLLIGDVQCDRPGSWHKLPLLKAALEEYDEVLWLDADVVIVDASEDPFDLVPPQRWHALVRHHTPDGEVPNCGVWLLRPPMSKVLQSMWEATQYIDHVWWEQAAMLDLLGYRHEPRPCALAQQTLLYDRTEWLGLEWNSHEQSNRHHMPNFAHVTPGPVAQRLPIMLDYARQAAVRWEDVSDRVAQP